MNVSKPAKACVDASRRRITATAMLSARESSRKRQSQRCNAEKKREAERVDENWKQFFDIGRHVAPRRDRLHRHWFCLDAGQSCVALLEACRLKSWLAEMMKALKEEGTLDDASPKLNLICLIFQRVMTNKILEVCSTAAEFKSSARPATSDNVPVGSRSR
jgi:hypothetical protein